MSTDRTTGSTLAPPAFFQNDRLRIIHDDILTTRQVKSGSVDLIVTSPPYNVDIRYGNHHDGGSYEEYLSFTTKWMSRCAGSRTPAGSA